MKINQKIQETFQSLRRNFSQGIFMYDSSLAKSQDRDYVIQPSNPVWQSFCKGLIMGFGIMLGMFGTGVMAVAVTGTIKTWTANEKLTASDLNTTISSLKTAIESIPNWTKNGTSAYYNDGNVGIGTNSPTEKLQVNGNLLVNGNITSQNTGQKIVAYPTLSAGNPDYTWSGQTTTGMYLPASGQIGFSTGGTEKVRINSNGNVGIGSSSPPYLLHVYRTGYNAIGISGDGTSATDLLLITKSSSSASSLESATSKGWAISGRGDSMTGGQSNDLQFIYFNGTNYNPMMAIDSATGYVGIGTPGPSYTLHVNGSVAGTSAYNNLSDGRYKENIQPIPNALDKIEKLRGVSYTWKNKEYKELKFKEGQDLGFIGQEVEKVIPEVISKDDKGILSIAYSNIIPVLVEGIKELKRNQSEKVEELSFRLNLVTENLKTMTDENMELKKQLSELRQENQKQSISFEERLKALEEIRYAKK